MPSNPCSNCRRTDQGKLRYWYLNGYEGDRAFKYRLRMCGTCQESLLMDLITVADAEGPRGTWLAPEERQ
jgi:hypothetical protein